MDSLRTITVASLVVLLANVGGTTARPLPPPSDWLFELLPTTMYAVPQDREAGPLPTSGSETPDFAPPPPPLIRSPPPPLIRSPPSPLLRASVLSPTTLPSAMEFSPPPPTSGSDTEDFAPAPSLIQASAELSAPPPMNKLSPSGSPPTTTEFSAPTPGFPADLLAPPPTSGALPTSKLSPSESPSNIEPPAPEAQPISFLDTPPPTNKLSPSGSPDNIAPPSPQPQPSSLLDTPAPTNSQSAESTPAAAPTITLTTEFIAPTPGSPGDLLAPPPTSGADFAISPTSGFNCGQFANVCDFKFQGAGVPTFTLIGSGDNTYGPVIVDKANNPTGILKANGNCKIIGAFSNICNNNFYFEYNRVASRTFNKPPVEAFKGKCIRIDISNAQLADKSELTPSDGNANYPRDRRCVIFHAA